MAASKSIVDLNRLKDAIDDHSHAVATVKKHRMELETLRDNIRELTKEILDLDMKLSDRNVAQHSIDMDSIKSFAHQKLMLQGDIEALREARDDLNAVVNEKQRDYSALDCYAESGAIAECWSIIYDGYLSAIDLEPLNHLITLGTLVNKGTKDVINDLNLAVDTRRLTAMVQQYNLPVGAV